MGTLRLFLALSVLVAHTEGELFDRFTLLPTLWAVQAFYLVSGFTMGMVLELKYRNAYKKFLFNRIIRLYPVYTLTVLATAALLLWAQGQGRQPIYTLDFYQKTWSHLDLPGRCIVVASNLLLEGKEALNFFRFDPGTWSDLRFNAQSSTLVGPFHLMLIPPAWTLGIEFLFYLLAPFCALWPSWKLAALALASLGMRVLTYASGFDQGPWLNSFFPSELFFFVMGLLGWRLFNGSKEEQRLRLGLALVGAGMLAWTLYRKPVPDTAQDYSGVSLALWATLCLPQLYAWSKGSRADRYLGRLAYPLYLTHMLVIQLMYYLFALRAQERVGTAALLTLALCALLVHAVEAPVERWRAQASARWAWLNR